MKSKTILITGGHNGIGFECSKQLASRNYNLILAGRSPQRMLEAANSLRSEYGVQVDTLDLDTASLASVRAAVEKIRSMSVKGQLDTLYAILCNAGKAGQNPITYSPEGYESLFATNCLGHFLLINLLLDLLPNDGRIVFTASGTHDPETGDGRMSPAADPDARVLAFQGKDGGQVIAPQRRYATSKLCTILYAYELDRQLRRSGSSIVSIAFDPGGIAETSFARGLPGIVQFLIKTSTAKWLMKRMGVNVGSLPVAGKSLAQLAVDPKYANSSGKYYLFCSS